MLGLNPILLGNCPKTAHKDFLSFFGVFLSLFLYDPLKKIYLRYKARKSKSGKKMYRLFENKEDEFLTKSQQLEEKIKTIDYDVWVTETKEEIEITSHISSWNINYKTCQNCNSLTAKIVHVRITKYPTYSRTGSKIIKLKCEYCNHGFQIESIIPKEEASTSRSSGSSSSSRSGSGFSGGGGSSGGGGASGGW